MMRRSLAAIAAAAGLLAGLVATSPASAQDDTGTVYVVHALDGEGTGVGGTPVTVCVDGEQLLDNLTVGETEGPLELPAGEYLVEIVPGADMPCGDPIIAEEVEVAAGANVSLVAYTNPDIGFTIGVFPNPLDCAEEGDGRLTARHTANAGPVDVFVDGELAFEDLAAGSQESADLGADTYDVEVTASGDPGTVVIPSTPVEVLENVSTVVYVFGGGAEPTIIPFGVFTYDFDVDPCEEPLDPETPAEELEEPLVDLEPAPGEPSEALRATPRFTG